MDYSYCGSGTITVQSTSAKVEISINIVEYIFNTIEVFLEVMYVSVYSYFSSRLKAGGAQWQQAT